MATKKLMGTAAGVMVILREPRAPSSRQLVEPGNSIQPAHRRKVDWASEPLRRWDLSIPFQKTLGAQKTVFRVSHTGEFLETRTETPILPKSSFS